MQFIFMKKSSDESIVNKMNLGWGLYSLALKDCGHDWNFEQRPPSIVVKGSQARFFLVDGWGFSRVAKRRLAGYYEEHVKVFERLTHSVTRVKSRGHWVKLGAKGLCWSRYN